MSKTASVYARVEPELKEQAEEILADLGIPTSSAVNLFLRQVVVKDGIPLEVKREKERLGFYVSTKEELDAKLQQGFDDIAAGRVYTIDEVEEHMYRKYGI